MPNKKITQLTELTAPAMEDLLVIVDDVAGTAVTKKITIENLASDNPGAAAQILRTNASGQLQLSGSVGIGVAPVSGTMISASFNGSGNKVGVEGNIDIGRETIGWNGFN